MKGLEGLREAVRKLLRSSGSYERSINEFIRDLQRTLLKADVNVRLVFQLTRNVKKRALEEKPPPGITRREWVIKILLDELTKLFGGLEEPDVLPKKKPYILMLVGIQGSGKTTRVLIPKAKQLIEADRINPKEILLLSFSRLSAIDLQKKGKK